ncbi:MAG: hypothetical protein V1833_05245 [Elusimicrobiota bacterium]
MKNEILSEVWFNRNELVKRYNYDIDTMVAALQEMERHPWSVIVDRRKEIPDETASGMFSVRKTNV